MLDILVPVDGRPNALGAVRHALLEYQQDHRLRPAPAERATGAVAACGPLPEPRLPTLSVTSSSPADCWVLADEIDRSRPETSRTPLTMVSSELLTWVNLLAEASTWIEASPINWRISSADSAQR